VKDLLPYLVLGVTSGSLYGLAALGLVLTYRTSGVFNFGHGAIAAAAAFLFYELHVVHGMAWPVAAMITIVGFGVVVGLVLERLTRALADAPEAVVVVATVGILLGVEGYLLVQFGDVTRNFPAFLPQSGFDISGVHVSWAQTISVVIAAASATGLYLFLRRARLGVAMRAVVDNPTLVGLVGDRPARVRGAAWIIGSSFAALSGILLAPTLNLDANLLTFLVVQAFGAAAIGLFSNLPLTYAGGLIVGIFAAFATKQFTHPPFNGVPAAVPFAVLVVVLLVVPARRLPRPRLNVRDLVGEGRRVLRGPAQGVVAALVLAGLLVVPHVVGTKLPVWISGLIYVELFASLALLVWTSGQISLCHATFAALGATTMAHLTSSGVPWLGALLLAGLLTVPVGALVAIPAIRVSGIYLALATFGFAVLMQDVIYNTFLMFGAKQSVESARPHLGFITGSDQSLYHVVLAMTAVVCLALLAVQRSRLGRLLRAMSETPTMLATNGLSVNVTRLLVFCLSAFFAGIAGALVVTQSGAVNTTGFVPVISLIWLAVLTICGTSLIPSAFLAAALFAVVPGYLTRFNTDRQTLAFGVVALAAATAIARRADLLALFRRESAATSGRRLRSPVHERRQEARTPTLPAGLFER
jgi:branched-subunit amino acid ABC-type transport system permease component